MTITAPAPESTSVCLWEGCSSTETISRGLCRSDYNRAYRKGWLEEFAKTHVQLSSTCVATYEDGTTCGRTDIHAHGLCTAHVSQQRRGSEFSPITARSMPTLAESTTPVQWALHRVTITEEGHWLWQGQTDKDGYARATIDNRTIRVHRWLYEKLHGPIPADWDCDHACSVRNCIAPFHCQALPKSEHHAASQARRQSRKLWLSLVIDGTATLHRQLQPALFRMSAAWLVAKA